MTIDFLLREDRGFEPAKAFSGKRLPHILIDRRAR
jgi:hypothetical protein